MPTKKTKYLGETTTDTYEGIPIANITRMAWALTYIERYGQIDGEHHKAWCLDQVARILLGTPVIVTIAAWADGNKEERITTGEPSAEYMEWAASMWGKWDELLEEHEYRYDEGIAP